MKKIYLLWLASLFILAAFFVSSRLKSPHTQTPEAAMRHLLISMRNKDLAGIDEVCTESGKERLAKITKVTYFKDLALYDFLKARGFRYDAKKHDSWDVWQARAKNVDEKSATRSHGYSSVSEEDFVFVFPDKDIAFIFTKTLFGGWKLKEISNMVVR